MINLASVLSTYLSRYEVKGRLGSGGMATVYRATDTNLGRDVAIKVLHEHLVHDGAFKERFEREARIIAAFNHPSIVQIYDFDTIDTGDEKFYYMVMPYLSGESLIDVLDACRERGETLSHARINEIVSDLADALDYAHARGMIHRDVKPANILFDDQNRAVLTDFGIARLAQTSNLTAEGTIIGTPAYMSPEQASGDETDHRSDIYSLGVILFELLTGRPPFDDDSTVSLILKHVQTPPPRVSEFMEMVNPALDSVLNKVLEKDRALRYQSAGQLKHELETAINQDSSGERFKPAAITPKSADKTGKQPETVVLAQETGQDDESVGNAVTHTINTLVLKPAKQNPLGFVALIVAVFALLLFARFGQFSEAVPAVEPTVDTQVDGVESMAGIERMVGDAAFFTGDFSDDDGVNVYWEITPSGTVTRTIEDGFYRISNSQAGLAVTAMLDEEQFQYDDVNIVMEGRILETSASPSSAFGIVFRYQDSDNYNVFAVDGMQRYSIWKRQNGQWCELRTECNGGSAEATWEDNEAINQIGETNQLTLNVYGDQIAGYVNDSLVIMLEDTTFDDGAIGIYMATTQFGKADVSIDSYDVALGMPPSADSMTGE